MASHRSSARPLDLVGLLIGLDEGTLTGEEEVGLFQRLVDTGLAWRLQGRIGRQARDMIEAGLVGVPLAA